MNQAAIDRIVHRLSISHGGEAKHVEGLTWSIEIPEDIEQEDGPKLAFHNAFKIEGDRVTEIACDAPVGRYQMHQAEVVAGFQKDLAAALGRERAAFSTFEQVIGFLTEEIEAEVEGDVVLVQPDGEDAEAVTVSCVNVAHEPWISFSTPFLDDVDPAWLLERSGELTHIHFESFEGQVSLAGAFPLHGLTAERLLELLDDLVSFRESFLAELAEGDEEEDEDEG